MRAVWLILTFLWFLLVAVWSVRAGAESGFWELFAALRFTGLSRASLEIFLVVAGRSLLPLVVLGALTRLACSSEGAFTRFIAPPLAALLAMSLAVVLAGLAGGVSWHPPAIVELILPFAASLVGTLVGGAFDRPPGRILPALLVRLLLLALVLLAGVLALAFALLDRGPATPFTAAITAAEKRALIETARQHNPLALAPGRQIELTLDPESLTDLLNWGAQRIDSQGAARVVAVERGLGWEVSVSMPIAPRVKRYLNFGGTMGFDVRDGRITIGRCTFVAGSIRLSHGVCRSILVNMLRTFWTDPDFAEFAAAVQSLLIDADGLRLRYARPNLDAPGVQRLWTLFGPGPAIRNAVAAQFGQMRANAGRVAQSADRFKAMLEDAFALALARSAEGDAVVENQGAILALAVILGHERIAMLAGLDLPEDWGRIRGRVWPVKLRGRLDWTRHFFVSAALGVLSTGMVSDTAGLLKEEFDAAGGSGFSFADLLADRAGNRFALLAVRDPDSARGLQLQMANRFRVGDLMPSADGLPEGLTDVQVEERFGGVGGPGYQALIADIEQRIERLPGPNPR